MTTADQLRTIIAVKSGSGSSLILTWSDGTEAELDLSGALRLPAFSSLRDPAVFRQVQVGEWGHSLTWPGDVEMGADSLWLDTLAAIGREDTRTFLEWRLRNGLSLSGAADALGISRRQVAYYSSGEKPVPKSILLACRGWEVSRAA